MTYFAVLYDFPKGYSEEFAKHARVLPLIKRGRGGVKYSIHFHGVLHTKRGGGGPDSM